MKKKMLQKNFKVIANNKIKSGYFKLVLEAPAIASIAKPGQFVMVQVSQRAQGPLLRRPMSIHSVKKDKVEILYAVAGQGTQMLSRKRSGGYLDVVGPLGNGFEIPGADSKNAILVAGGMGVAPLLFFAQKIIQHRMQNEKRKTLVLIGAKNKNGLLCEKEFQELECDVKIATDDGSKGFKGKITDLLKKALPLATSDKPLAIYACGPLPMLKGIWRIASEYGISAWGSFETHMACGIGACMGCVIKAQSEKRKAQNDFVYKRVCKDGPVFALNQVIWGKE